MRAPPIPNALAKASEAPPPVGFRRTLACYYLHVFSYDFIFGYAIFPAYFQLEGAAPEMIGAILALWSAGIIVFEIPAGILADRLDRRILLLLSPVLKAACFAIWIAADGRIAFFFAGILCWSMASALRTGAKEALLYDNVAASAQLHRYTTILGRERGLQDAATLLGAACGGLIAAQHPDWAFWASFPALAICAGAACFIQDPRSQASASRPVAIGALLQSAWRDCSANADVRRVALYLAFCVMAFSTLEDFNQLFMLALEAPVWSLGLIVALIGVVRIALAAYATWFERFSAYDWLAPMVSGAALMCAPLLPQMLALAAMAGAFCLMAPLLVLTTSRLQRALAGASRATATSAVSAVMESFSLLFNVAIALAFAQWGVLGTYQAAGLYLVLFALWARTAAQRR